MDLKIYEWNKRLKALRAAKGWTSREAADKCGTTQKQYSNWECGKNYPHFNSRKAIANAFEVKVSEIFTEDKEQVMAK